MKQIEELRKEIRLIRELYPSGVQDSMLRHEKKAAKVAGKRLKLLLNCAYYLETQPTEAFVFQSIKSLERQLELSTSKFREWFQNTPGSSQLKNAKSAYENEMGVPTMKRQLSTLKFLMAA